MHLEKIGRSLRFASPPDLDYWRSKAESPASDPARLSYSSLSSSSGLQIAAWLNELPSPS